MESEPKLKNAPPSVLFINSGTEGNVIKQVMDEIDKIPHKKFKEKDLIGSVSLSVSEASSLKPVDLR